MLFSVSILVIFGYSQEAEAVGGTISNQFTCEQLGLTWEEPNICQVSGLLTIEFGEKITVSSDIVLQLTTSGRIDNSGTIDNNSGTIDNSGDINNNSGTIDNFGTIDNKATGTIRNTFDPNTIFGGTIDNKATGVINNFGTITNFAGISNSGTIDNKGTGTIENFAGISNTDTGIIENAGLIRNPDGRTSRIFNSGDIKNSGTIEIGDRDQFTNSDTGTIENSGEITIFGSIFGNGGTIDNKATGIINSLSSSFDNFGAGEIINDGEINFDSGKITNFNSATIDNSGTINNIFNQRTQTVTFTNFGTINNSGDINNNSGTIDNSGGTINNNGGTINNSDIFGNSAFGTIINSGDINILGVISNSGTIDNFGTIDNSDIFGTIDNSGTINNCGTINGEISGVQPNPICPTCGNGGVNPGEECDDGNLLNDDECSNLCSRIFCFNNRIDPGEQCDDGGVIAGDGCSATCQTEAGFTCTGQPSVCLPAPGAGDLQGRAQIAGSCGAEADPPVTDLVTLFNFVPSGDFEITITNPGNAPAEFRATRTACQNDMDTERPCTLKFAADPDVPFADKTEVPVEPASTQLAEVVPAFTPITRQFDWRLELATEQDILDDAGKDQRVTVTVSAICDRDAQGNPNQVCPAGTDSINGVCT